MRHDNTAGWIKTWYKPLSYQPVRTTCCSGSELCILLIRRRVFCQQWTNEGYSGWWWYKEEPKCRHKFLTVNKSVPNGNRLRSATVAKVETWFRRYYMPCETYTKIQNNLTDILGLVKVLLLFLSSQNIGDVVKLSSRFRWTAARMRVVRNQDGSHISVIGVADARQNKIIGNLTGTSTHTLRSMLDGVYEKIFDADDACKCFIWVFVDTIICTDLFLLILEGS